MEDPVVFLLYVLGFVGLAAVGLLPLRCWRFAYQLVPRSRSSRAGAGALLLLVLLGTSALMFEAAIVFRVFRCLTETYCGPSVAHGWLYLAMLGAAYLAFELMATIVSAVARYGTRSAA